MTDPDTDPYTAYYEFEPVLGATDDSGGRGTTRKHAEIVHELGLAGSPCQERSWGTKVEVRCPGCGATGKVVSWDGTDDVYACFDCDTAFHVPFDGSDRRPTHTDGNPTERATVRQ